MDPVWINISTFLTVFTLAIVSPGPNFILVVDRSLAGSRKEAIFTSLGVATGSGLFGLAGMIGLIVVVNSLPHFAVLIRMLGGGYLAWLGVNMIRESLRSHAPREEPLTGAIEIAPWTAWKTGLLTNLTNPKAWAFYFALFTVVMSPGFLLWQKIILNSSMFLISFSWYALVATLITSAQCRPLFQKIQPIIQLILGFILIGLGGQMFLTF